MIRIPNSINSKNDLQVKIVQSWDRKRPDIRLLLGSFYAWMLTHDMKQQEIVVAYSNSTNQYSKQKYGWIELRLLRTGLNDHRKTIVNLVLAPYLVNIQNLSFEQASSIIHQWLDLCKRERPFDFNVKHLVNAALIAARKSSYKPISSRIPSGHYNKEDFKKRK